MSIAEQLESLALSMSRRRQCDWVVALQNRLAIALSERHRLKIHLEWAKLSAVLDFVDPVIKRQVRSTILPVMIVVLREMRIQRRPA